MKARINFIKVFISVVTASCIMVSCATTTSARVQRPAEVTVENASTVAILPFSVDNYAVAVDLNNVLTLPMSQMEAQDIAENITEAISSNVIRGNFYDLVDSNSVKYYLSTSRIPPCDMYITGKLTKVNITYDTNESKYTDSKGVERTKTEYKKNVNVVAKVQIVDASSKKILFQNTYELSDYSGYNSSMSSLSPAAQLISSDIKEVAQKICKKIQPYYENVSYTLLEDKTKDAHMKDANKLADKGYYEAARKMFLDCYMERGYFEAGYNAAILYETQGMYEQAKNLMTELAEKYRNPKAYSALSDINLEIKKQEKLKNQLNRGKSTVSGEGSNTTTNYENGFNGFIGN